MKKVITSFTFFIICACIQAQDLAWSINFQKGSDRNSLEPVQISQVIRMQTGEFIKFTIQPESNAYCYIILYDSGQKISILFNELVTRQGMDFGPAEIEEPSGTETIYVILSLERQANLERLIQEFERNPDSGQTGNNLRREVVSLQNSVSRLGEPASSYIQSGGTTRGASTQQYVTRFSGKNIYVRAIAIRH